MRYAALLRGINLGNRRMVMADLRRVLETEGADDVATHLQSGNAVFTIGESDPDVVRGRLEAAIGAEFGFDVPLVLVTAEELAAVIAACPYRVQADADPTKVHVTFFDPMPSDDAWSGFDLAALAPEGMATGPGVLFMHLPNGMGRAVLPGLLAKATSKVTATTRNWRTVIKLAGMLEVG